MLEGKVVRVVKNVIGGLDESLLKEMFVVMDHFPRDEKNLECVKIDASTVNKNMSRNYFLYKGEYEVVDKEEAMKYAFKRVFGLEPEYETKLEDALGRIKHLEQTIKELSL